MKQNKYYSFLLLVLLVMLGACKEQRKENTKETPKTEQIQTPQESQAQQTASAKYQSHNYYKNNVTEYLEIKTDGSVFYSTSTRPNQIKMIVTAGDKDGYFESFIEFPKGTGDGQRYGIRKSGGNLMVGIPNTDAPPQVYTPQTGTSQTEDLQVTQPQQMPEMTAGPQIEITGLQTYKSHNYYGNNVTEYLEISDGSVVYRTSARPNRIQMIVTKGNKPNESILRFPKGAGDNQRYRMKIADIGIIITTPNGKNQIYSHVQH